MERRVDLSLWEIHSLSPVDHNRLVKNPCWLLWKVRCPAGRVVLAEQYVCRGEAACQRNTQESWIQTLKEKSRGLVLGCKKTPQSASQSFVLWDKQCFLSSQIVSLSRDTKAGVVHPLVVVALDVFLRGKEWILPRKGPSWGVQCLESRAVLMRQHA